MNARRAGVIAVLALIVTACASPPPQPLAPERAGSPWPVVMRDHVDLWLHGFGMIQDDTAHVPFFERGYRERMTEVRRRANVSTALDANRETLRAGMAARPSLINAQFLAMYFASWRDVQRATELFLQAEGDPRRSGDPNIQAIIATMAGVFPTRADRDWLRLFVTSLREEQERFYSPWWTAQQRDREDVLARIDTLWETTYRPRFQRYLNSTQLPTGTVILSLPLGGEGRTVMHRPPGPMIATSFPADAASAPEVFHVFAHEAIHPVVQTTVNDHLSPVQRREGLATRYVAMGTVRGGLLLIERVSPDLADGYMRYYLRAAGQPVPAGDPRAAFAQAFPLPDAMHDAIAAQLDVVLGGI